MINMRQREREKELLEQHQQQQQQQQQEYRSGPTVPQGQAANLFERERMPHEQSSIVNTMLSSTSIPAISTATATATDTTANIYNPNINVPNVSMNYLQGMFINTARTGSDVNIISTENNSNTSESSTFLNRPTIANWPTATEQASFIKPLTTLQTATSLAPSSVPFSSSMPNISIRTPSNSYSQNEAAFTAPPAVSYSHASSPSYFAGSTPLPTSTITTNINTAAPVVTTATTTNTNTSNTSSHVNIAQRTTSLSSETLPTMAGAAKSTTAPVPTHRCMHCLLTQPSWTKMQTHLLQTQDTLPKCAVCGKQLNCFDKHKPWKHEVDSFFNDVKQLLGIDPATPVSSLAFSHAQLVELAQYIKPHLGFFGTYHARVEYKLESQIQGKMYHSGNKFTGLTVLQYRCVCGITFVNTVHLVNHLKRVHHVTGLPEQARCLTCHCTGTTEEIEIHMRNEVVLVHETPSSSSPTTTTTTMTSSPNTNLNTPSAKQVSFTTLSTTTAVVPTTTDVVVGVTMPSEAAPRQAHQVYNVTSTLSQLMPGNVNTEMNSALLQASAMRGTVLPSSQTVPGELSGNMILTTPQEGNRLYHAAASSFQPSTRIPQQQQQQQQQPPQLEPTRVNEASFSNTQIESATEKSVSDPFNTSSELSAYSPVRSIHVSDAQLSVDDMKDSTYVIRPTGGEDSNNNNNNSSGGNMLQNPFNAAVAVTGAFISASTPTTQMPTEVSQLRRRYTGQDHGGCPHEVEVPGFVSGPFLHFSPLLPPLPPDEYAHAAPEQTETSSATVGVVPPPPLPSSLSSQHITSHHNTNLAPFTNPHHSLSSLSSLPHDTQTRLVTLPTSSVMLSALGRPIDHTPVYRVLYQCKQCCALFSSWGNMTDHMERTMHGRGYCVKEHQFIPHQHVKAPRHPAPCTPLENRTFEEQERQRAVIREMNKTRTGKERLSFDPHLHRFDH